MCLFNDYFILGLKLKLTENLNIYLKTITKSNN